MNAVEIEQAISDLALEPYSHVDFPFKFLEAFGNKDATIKKLRSGTSNLSDIQGGVLQRTNIHIATCAKGEVGATLKTLRDSPKTKTAKAKFILATDGDLFESEDLVEGLSLACDYGDFANHFGFFLPLAGFSTVRSIRDNPIDIQATSKLNRLYVELLKNNPDWSNDARRHDLNQFIARLIFCFFAEDTGIFHGEQLFTSNLEKYSDATNTHEVIARMFKVMDTKLDDRKAIGVAATWVDHFPYVNGGLFGGGKEIPKFSRIARSYLIAAGSLDWKAINPDIFGSMIQAVADDGERGELGMHYTSVPNILKVLNPLFLDDVREKLAEAGDNKRKLLALRRRLAAMRVFDPACGSGNFLVIAYIQMREIEAEIIARRGDDKKSWIKLTQFYGIELKDFAAEIARLALLIAEFQSDVRLIGQQEALIDVLPLKNTGLITQGNALRLDWLTICPPVTKTMVEEWDLGGPTGRLALEANGLDGDEVEPETYICGNPPYRGSTWQTEEQKADLKGVFGARSQGWKSLDYVAGWLMKAADFGLATPTASAFVSTNSICQGQQVPILWPLIFATGNEIFFAHTSFKWANLASHNAGVTVIVVGLSRTAGKVRRLLSVGDDGVVLAKAADNINAYLVAAGDVVVEKSAKPLTEVSAMNFGNKPVDGGHLLLSSDEVHRLGLTPDQRARFIRRIYGSAEFIRGQERFCLWIEDRFLDEALAIEPIRQRVEGVRRMRGSSNDKSAQDLALRAHQMREMNSGNVSTIAVAAISSENRPFLPVGLLNHLSVTTNKMYALYDAPLWNMALIASRLHWVWIGTVCVRMRTDFSYSNTLGWNTFPVPPLSDTQKADLTTCAQDILLAREAHWPATIADLYDPKTMPENLVAAHDRNDQTLERIYIGRRFKNDTERLEKLFAEYTKMTVRAVSNGKKAQKSRQKAVLA